MANERRKRMFDFSKLTPLPNRMEHTCFGCGDMNECGLQMKFHTDGKDVYSRLTIPGHLSGWQNLAHGGVISTVLDEIMSWTTVFNSRKLFLTRGMSVEYIKPILVGKEIYAHGKIIDLKSDREAHLEGEILDADGTRLASATSRFILFSFEKALEKGMMDETTLRKFRDFVESVTLP